MSMRGPPAVVVPPPSPKLKRPSRSELRRKANKNHRSFKSLSTCSTLTKINPTYSWRKIPVTHCGKCYLQGKFDFEKLKNRAIAGVREPEAQEQQQQQELQLEVQEQHQQLHEVQEQHLEVQEQLQLEEGPLPLGLPRRDLLSSLWMLSRRSPRFCPSPACIPLPVPTIIVLILERQAFQMIH